MPTRRPSRAWLIAVSLILLGGLVWFLWPKREPVYQGKPLSAWFNTYYSNSVVQLGAAEHIDAAIRQAGPDAIPVLLRYLRASDSPAKLWLVRTLRTLRLYRGDLTPASYWNPLGARGFSILGPDAQSAVPDLIDIATGNDSESSRFCALIALGSIGPGASNAIPTLLSITTKADPKITSLLRIQATNTLKQVTAPPGEHH